MKQSLLSCFALFFIAGVSWTQPVQHRPGNAYVKTSLNAYSFSKMLNDHLKDTTSGMSMEALLEFTAAQHFDAIDITGYYFPGYPKKPPTAFINRIKRKAFLLGLDISGTGVKNDFAHPDPSKRAADVQLVKDWIDVAQQLGAPIVRIFSGNIPPGYEHKWDSIAGYMAACIKECVAYAKTKGILIGVQNHADFLKTADETIRLLKLVNSEWLGVVVDIGSFVTPDPYIDVEKVMPYAVNFQFKESPFGAKSPVKTDIPRVLGIIKRSGYRGYIPIETLSGPNNTNSKGEPYDPVKSVPEFLAAIKKEIHH
ncbi:sugar phosphate isomerase/epimerase family protein [Niabella drilacis]|uniref:Sugar phosphate isomerase/epimerase n=1 Tax=Niabella drilacis (strain DSM 25811 / CCM 8410 / CCUG 62505 / LMG 26954 / E90) TaxID=1285928 RepID=A0A1G6SER8_NIADE|nr:sugar phosphate isomerase/epimerase family protein [Niabella drilacis]SDD14676.1 Sugar phosphate isomerase/epimerase [Niabella drilacis]